MAFTTYDELQTAVGDWLNRTDLDAVIPDFIRLAEAKFSRHLAVEDEVRTTLVLDDEVVDLPAVCREVRSLYLDQEGYRGPIEIVAPEALADKKTQYGPTGHPRFAAIVSDGTQLQLAPVPGADYVAGLHYIAGLVVLSDAAPSNWLLATYPDLYLYGSLVESAPYLKDDPRVPVWKNERDERLADLDALNQRRKFGANTLVMRPKAIG